MLKKLKKKHAFVKKFLVTDKKPHLWVNLTGCHSYGEFNNSHLLVNITTYYKNTTRDDIAICIIDANEHSYLYVTSYVAYNYSKIIDDLHATSIASSNTYSHQPDISNVMHKKICQGFLEINEQYIDIDHKNFLISYLTKEK